MCVPLCSTRSNHKKERNLADELHYDGAGEMGSLGKSGFTYGFIKMGLKKKL